jgi:hypothetical protein
MKFECVCGYRFGSGLGKAKCKKCGREYVYERIAKEADLDYETCVYILNEELVKKPKKEE